MGADWYLRKTLNVKVKKQSALKSGGKLMALNKQPQRTTRLLAGAQCDRAVVVNTNQKGAAKFRVRVGTEFTCLQRVGLDWK